MRESRSQLVAALILAGLAASLAFGANPVRPFTHLLRTFWEVPIEVKEKVEPGAHTSLALGPALGDANPKQRAQFTLYRSPEGEVVCRAATDEEVRQRERETKRLGLRPINHPELFSIDGTKKEESVGTGLIIILRATQQLQQNQAAVTAFTRAAQNWETLVISPVTIYIDVDFGPTFFGQTYPGGVLGATGAPDGSYPYESVRANMNAEAAGEGNTAKQAVFNALPGTTVTTDLGVSSSTVVSDATARAIGLLPATAASADPAAKIGFNSNFSFDFDANDGITSNQIDFDAVATHEIGHALGFHSEAGFNLPRPSVWDLYRFRTGTTNGTFTNAQRILTIGGSPNPLQYFFVPDNAELGLSTGGPNGSTFNGGDGWQSSHWKHVTGCSGYIGIMDPAIPTGCRRTINANDLLAISVFGYNLTNNVSPPPPPAPPPPPGNDNFANAQTISGCSGTVTGISFGATSESGEPSHAPNDSFSLSPNHTVWYRWQPPSSGTTTITTAGSEFDTILAVYTGGTVGSLARITFNDDAQSNTLTSSVTFSAAASTTYFIAVDGWGGDAGGVKLNWIGCGATPTPTPTPIPSPTATPTPTPNPSPGPCTSTLIVNENGDANDINAGNGVCATATGGCTLHAAIDEANALTPCGPIDINFSNVTSPLNLSTALPEINHNINLNGAGADLLTIQRNPTGGTPQFRILFISNSRIVTLTGLTIANGSVPNGSNGGGIYNSGTLTLTSCNVFGNNVVTSPANFGGGIYNTGTLTLNQTNLGGLAAGQANTATDGGGIYNFATIVMTGGSVAGNTGGGISNVFGGSSSLNGVSVTSNLSTQNGITGGVSVAPFSSATILNCVVANNSAATAGAGIYNGGTATVINTTISGNASAATGGGVVNQGGFVAPTIRMTNVTISNNRSDSDNNGAESGGGIFRNAGTVILKNTIVAGNFRGTGAIRDDINGAMDPTSAFNLVGDGSGMSGISNGNNANHVGTAASPINAGLAALGNNGGPTMTHALLTGSPAINTGSNALAVDQNNSPLLTDQRGSGFSRIADTSVDIGACEMQTGPVPTPTPTPPPGPCPTTLVVNNNGDASDAFGGDGVCQTADGFCTLRAAIQEANSRPTCGTVDINFSVSSPINLVTALPDVNHNVNFNGPGANALTVQRSADNVFFRILKINQGTVVTVTGLTLSNGKLATGNTGQDDGAGIYNSGVLSIIRSNVTDNTGDSGAGIYNLGALSVFASSVSGNRSIGGAGAGVFSSGTAILTNTAVANNMNGAGLFVGGGTTTIANATISSNATQGSGAGIVTAGGQTAINITNTTITANRADSTGTGSGAGGGIQIFGGAVTLKNTIVAANVRGTGSTPDDIVGAVSPSSCFNLIGTGGSGGLVNGSNNNQVDVANSLLGPLANNGGPTMTHAFLVGSPAINAGSNALAVDQNGSPLVTDQRGSGFDRIVNGAVDIGAFELGTAPLLFTDATNHVVAIDSVTFVRDPFSVAGLHNFSSDQRTRIMIFTSNLGLNQPTGLLGVTAGGIPLSVEAVGTLSGIPDTSYIIVKLDSLLTGNVQLSVTFQGATSNAGILSISP
jgi:CSLREA domain-containing protein